jgi:hypothetical protein
MEWVVLETAPNQIVAEMWCELLHREGVPAFARVSDGAAVSRGYSSPWDCAVMVPESHLKKASAVLDSILKPKPRRRRK